jgi:hypothetical protein
MMISLRSQFAARNFISMTENAGARHAGRIQWKVTKRYMAAAMCAGLLCTGHTYAQTRKGPAPPVQQDVLRAVSVYEWTGELAKPAAARVVPVSLFIDHHFEDAALYLSRPMPLALLPDNLYELESAGVNKGTLTLVQPSRLRSTNAVTSFDEGWFGYATWKPVAVPKPFVPSTTTTNAHVISDGGGPHFTKTPQNSPTSTAPATTAQNKPENSSATPPADPNRPVLHHTEAPSTQTADATPPATTTPTPTPDQSKPSDTSSTSTANADRPTLRRAPTTNEPKRRRDDDASVTDAGGLLGDDPGRPHLHHGIPSGSISPPALHGLPPDMHQMVAVSDAADRPEHDFTYTWTDANQKAAVMAKLEVLARTALAPAHTLHARKSAPLTLLNEGLHAYEISYGGVAVFVFTASTVDHRHVTLLAQADIYDALHVLLQSVAGATNLDEKPQMLFIDAIDADGDNRAELLFELRGETQRQFALYRIGQGTATQAFVSGTMQ